MEGACAKIHEESPTTVRKVMKRKPANQSLSAEEQAHVQQIAKAVIYDNKLMHIDVPTVFNVDRTSYSMEKIDDSIPLYEVKKVANEIQNDIQVFLTIMETKGWILNDIELYVQPDGRVAIIDFDKCSPTNENAKRKANPYLQFF